MKRIIRIATRSSPLALWQANLVKHALITLHPLLQVELLELTTQGDRELGVALTHLGGKSLFVKELQQALLEERADIAVHSIKDMSVHAYENLTLAAICQREDPRDAFISNTAHHFNELPQGAVIGTSSPRRQSMLKAKRPDLTTALLRGNVGTRLMKLDEGKYDAIILAAAGLKRLDFAERIKHYFDPTEFIPAIGQGALGIECRADDREALELTMPLNHTPTALCVNAERAVNRKLNGDCYTPIGAHAILANETLSIYAAVGSLDGTQIIHDKITGSATESEALGTQLGEQLLSQGAGRFL